jgi:hypothetical protein
MRAQSTRSQSRSFSWRIALRNFGQHGLRTTKLRLYGDRPERRRKPKSLTKK